MPDPEKAALMRSVNEGIALFAAGLESGDSGARERWSFVCECGARHCVEWVELDLPAYTQIRARRDVLVLADGHSRTESDGGSVRRIHSPSRARAATPKLRCHSPAPLAAAKRNAPRANVGR